MSALRLVFVIVVVILFGIDYVRLRVELSDYNDVREQALCAHASVINMGGHANDGKR